MSDTLTDLVKQTEEKTTSNVEIIKAEAEAKSRLASIEQYERAMQVNTTYMSPNTWTQIRTMAKVFFEGKALPGCIQNEAQLIMVMQAGFEMGMKPVECLKSLYIVKGTISVYGAAVVRRLREHGWRVQYKDETETSCTAKVSRDREVYEETYTFQEAQKSGHTHDNSGILKVGWKEGINRKLKLRYGVLSLIIKSYIPDVLGSASDIAEVVEDSVPEQAKPEEENKKEPKQGVLPADHKSLADKLSEAKTKKAESDSTPDMIEPEKGKKE